MKVLAISDTHGRIADAQIVIERLADTVSAVVHAGDMLSDAYMLASKYGSLPFHCVAGNCDYYFCEGMANEQPFKVVELCGRKIYLSHGHRENVKLGYTVLAERAKASGASIAVCGHTHEASIQKIDGVLTVNPGSITQPRGNDRIPSYAVIDLPDFSTGAEEDAQPHAAIVRFRR